MRFAAITVKLAEVLSVMRSSANLVGSWIEIESSTEEEDSDAEVLE
jgi:hypothetical protein